MSWDIVTCKAISNFTNIVVQRFKSSLLHNFPSYSDYNLAVPIAVHTLYDFITISSTWLLARDDLNRRLRLAAQSEASRLDLLSPKELEAVSDAVRIRDYIVYWVLS